MSRDKQKKRSLALRCGAMVRLDALLRGHRNLEMWCSFPEQKPKLYYVWSSGMGPMADRGEPTLEAAIEKFWRDHRHQHFKRSKPNNQVTRVGA